MIEMDGMSWKTKYIKERESYRNLQANRKLLLQKIKQ